MPSRPAYNLYARETGSIAWADTRQPSDGMAARDCSIVGGRVKVLTVRQPWAWLIVHGGKDIENRTWKTPYRGPLLIQASKNSPNLRAICDEVAAQFRIALPETFEAGGVVGAVTLTDCVSVHESRWFEGPVGWVLKDARAVPFIPCAGKLFLFDPPRDVVTRLADVARP